MSWFSSSCGGWDNFCGIAHLCESGVRYDVVYPKKLDASALSPGQVWQGKKVQIRAQIRNDRTRNKLPQGTPGAGMVPLEGCVSNLEAPPAPVIRCPLPGQPFCPWTSDLLAGRMSGLHPPAFQGEAWPGRSLPQRQCFRKEPSELPGRQTLDEQGQDHYANFRSSAFANPKEIFPCLFGCLVVGGHHGFSQRT